ncbi:hypothetical protein VTJ04DRAFT_10234 [Mycothermus thermophilus]|uniref:uncharacterized protein n=1 Tax=Humicola insolens TaxID=85995 RepID=UPI0037439CA4
MELDGLARRRDFYFTMAFVGFDIGYLESFASKKVGSARMHARTFVCFVSYVFFVSFRPWNACITSLRSSFLSTPTHWGRASRLALGRGMYRSTRTEYGVLSILCMNGWMDRRGRMHGRTDGWIHGWAHDLGEEERRLDHESDERMGI